MASPPLTGTTALVTGASRGFGRATAGALVKAGATVIGVGRDANALEAARTGLGARFVPVTGDAADPVLAGLLLEEHRPTTLVLNAGATPLSRPLQQHTWQTFSRNWDVDVQHVFHWTREALLLPLATGSTVITFSSGAALAGSPLSGGYAGAKATIRFITTYAGEESARDSLGIRFVALLPQLTPATSIGATAVAAYAKRVGEDPATFMEGRGPALEPDQVGQAVLDLATTHTPSAAAFVLSAGGLTPAR